MSNYYKEQKRALIELRNYIDQCRESQRVVSIPLLILSMTEKYEVSEKALSKRIILLSKAYEDMVVEQDVIRWSK